MADVFFRDKNRHHSSIMAEVLEITKEGTLKTHIMYKAALSYSQLMELLSFLLDRSLIEVVKTSGKTTYKTTDKGLRYLWHYREIMELLNGGKGNNPREVDALHLVDRGPRVTVASAQKELEEAES